MPAGGRRTRTRAACDPVCRSALVSLRDLELGLSSFVRVDILTRLGDAFRFEDLEIERRTFADLEVSVVSARTLYEMKKDTVRLRDKADAALLRERFGLEDE
jgi:hypothetical protein